MKKIGFRLLLLIVLISMLVAFTYMETKEVILSPTVSKVTGNYPTIAVRKNGILYNVMYPYKKDKDMLTGDSYTNFSPDEVIEIQIDDNKKILDITYEIVNVITGEILIKSLINKKNITMDNDQTIAKLLIPNLKVSEYPYVLKITYNRDSKTFLKYYQHFYLRDSEGIEKINDTVTKFHTATFDKNAEMINQLVAGVSTNQEGTLDYVDNYSNIDSILWKFDQDIIKMNEPNIRIKNIDNNNSTYEVDLTYTVAVRNNHAFEYWDFRESYKLTESDQIMIDSFVRSGSTKTDVYYDEKNIIIGSGKDNTIIQQDESDNKTFYSFVKNNQLWLFDGKNNRILKIFGFDKLDSDYVIDSYKQHNIKIIEMDDSGNITYIVYGYMNTGDYKGNNGLALYHFNYYTGNNENIGFIHLPYGYDELDYYVNQYTYIPKGNRSIYLNLEGSLYQFDLVDGSVKSISDDIPLNHERIAITANRKMLLWNESNNTKKNKTVHGIRIDRGLATDLVINENGLNNNLIGSYKDYFVIGYYDVQNTIEKLTGEVTYLYSKIQVWRSDGKVIDEYVPQQGAFYKDVQISINGIKLTTVKKEKEIHSNPRYSKIRLDVIRQEEIVLNTRNEEQVFGHGQVTSPYGYEVMTISSDTIKGSQLIDDTYIVKNSKKATRKEIIFIDDQKREYYQVIGNGTIEAQYDTITEALNAKGSLNTVILKQLETESNKIMYTSKEKNSMKITGIPVIPQKPELPRGCEVTSLSMLLNYYLTNKVDKMQLADEVEKDTTPYQVIDGMINFGDVHKGFVGDMANASNKGYAVYYEPIVELAEKYAPGSVLNITESSFEDVLYYVGIGRPVWVISPNIYRTVPSASIQQWKTPSGIIEMSYTEHSVLIIGYDEEYVYFNDPSKNMLRKKKIVDFRAGWEHLGNQAILIY